MSKSRYDWEPHIQRMHELYMAWMPIPDIWKEIQADGFTPSLRTLYYKFKSMHYPTDQHQRGIFIQRHTCRTWPPDFTRPSPSINPQVLGDSHTISTTRSPETLCSSSGEACRENLIARVTLPENDPIESGYLSHAGRTPDHSGSQAVSQFSSTPETQSFPEHWWGTSSEDLVDQEQHDQLGEFGTMDQIMDDVASDTLVGIQIPRIVGQMGSDIDRSSTEVGALLRLSAPPSLPYSHEEVASMRFHERFGSCPRSVQTRGTIYPPTPPLGQISLHIDGKSAVVQKSLPPFESHFAPSVDDSGYSGSRYSTSSDGSEHELNSDPKSLTEFGGLHRTPCCQLHEPLLHDRQLLQEHVKSVTTCSRCLYSRFHSLGWSARHLPLEVFQTQLEDARFELERERFFDADTLQDLISLDATGNSSLHYAAAGGARFEHFRAFMENGVSPYQLNTAGQLFLHCWKPHIDKSIQGSHEHNLSLYYEHLESLLNLLPWPFFRWRDNEGKTVFDSLVSVIQDEAVQQRTFSLFRSKLPCQVFSHSMSNFHRNLCPSMYQRTSPGLFASESPQDLETHWNDEFSSHQGPQRREWLVLGHAATDPFYIDPETGDSVLHALARLALPRNALLFEIQRYISQDVDLNLPNKEGEYPLMAFIRGRPSVNPNDDETGAQRSKYLEALMWKDSRVYNRVPNQINVNIRDRSGASALYHAATRGQPDAVRSLIERGANVNERLAGDQPISILQATINARDAASIENDPVKMDRFKNVIDYLIDERAVLEPTIDQVRQRRHKSLMRLPI